MPPCPIVVRGLIGEAAMHPVGEGESGCTIWSVGDSSDRLFLKHAVGRFRADLTAEHERLSWLAGRLPVPAIRAFVNQDDEAWLVTSGLPGRSGDAMLEDGCDPIVVAEAAGRFLRSVHALPVADCPFDERLPRRMAAARANIDAGLVDEDDFDDERAGWSAEQVWSALTALLPLPIGEVVTHGDYSLGNVLFDQDAQVTGCIDVGRVGIADPYQDVAIMLNNLRDFGSEAATAFLSAYGLVAPDEKRLRAHLMLDELF